MNIQSTRAGGQVSVHSESKQAEQQDLSQRVVNEARDSFVQQENGLERAAGGAATSALGSLAGTAAGAAVVAGIAQVADAVIPGDAFPVTSMIGPIAGVSAATLATLAAVRGGIDGYQAKAGAHTDALSTRRAFREAAGFTSTASAAFLGGVAAWKAVQYVVPDKSAWFGVAGAAAGAVVGAKVGKTTELFGGNLATIPMKKNAGMEGSQYSGKLKADAPPKQAETHSRFTPIFDDKNMTADVMKTLESAQESIRFETYLLNGEDGKALCDLLIKKAKEGLDVKVILDPFFQNFEAKRYEGDPNYSLGSYLKENGVDYLPYPVGKLTGSMTPSEHAKILVVDDKVAYLGGTNIDDTNNQDTNVKIEGASAGDIAKLFDESWLVSKNPDENVLGLTGDPTISDPNIKVFSTSPSRSTIKQAVIDNIREARKSIKIQMFTLTDDDLVEELEWAAHRGVDVQLQLCDNKEIFHLPTFHVPNLPTALQGKKSGIDVKWYVNPEFTQMHSKLMIFDEETTMLGSMNGIHNAFRGIHEYYSEIKDKDLAKQMSEKFQDDWDNRSEEVTSSLGYRVLGGIVEGLDGTVF